MTGEFESDLFVRIDEQERQNKQQRQIVATARLDLLLGQLRELERDFSQFGVTVREGHLRRDAKEHCLILHQHGRQDGGANVVVYDGQFFQALGHKRPRQIPGPVGTELSGKIPGMGQGEAVSKSLGPGAREAVELIVRALVSTKGLPLPNCSMDTGDYVAKAMPKPPGFGMTAWTVLLGGLFAIGVMVYFLMR
jgi:hypothetical protein